MSAITPEEVVDSAAISSASARRRSLWALAIRNPAVIFGGTILMIMVAIAVLAPYLGTVDPTRIDPAARNKKPDTRPITRPIAMERIETATPTASDTRVP